ncbi:polysaccharide deacetylase family protein [bacterium]|nr:polysaccharide deacetylase family protein [bacterium]
MMLQLRDWTYDHYHWAFLVGTGVICQSVFFPDPKATTLAWLGCVSAGALLEPCVNPYRQLYGRSLGRLSEGVALTYDDGPGPDTPALLDLLAREKVKASFFLIGQQIEKYPEVVKRIADEGHLIGNHTYSHPNLMLCSPGRTRRELERVQQQLQQLTGQKPVFWRPPFGFRSPWTQPVASQLGLRSALWTVNPRDFQDPGSQVIVQRTQEGLQPGVIVLLHDGLEKRGQTLEATARLISQLKETTNFVRLDQTHG